MSYILDSLKKSEQKRKQLEQPGLHSEPLGVAGRRPARYKPWQYLLVVALLLNAGLLGWYLFVKTAPTVANLPQTAQLPSPAPNAPVIVETSPHPTAPLQPPRTVEPVMMIPTRQAQSEQEQFQKQPIEEQPFVVTKQEPLPLEQMSIAKRQQLPPLILSLHYFAAETGNSMIRLDNVILRVGDSVENGLTVHEIVRDGVVLDYHGRLLWLDRPQG